MDNNEFVAMIKDLKELREIRDAAKDLVRARKAELLSDDELVVNTGLLEKVSADVEKLEYQLKSALVKNPEYVPPFKAAWLINSTSVKCEMRVFKDGNAWCFVLPDFQDLQVSSSVWMKEGVLDKIYKELRSVRNERH